MTTVKNVFADYEHKAWPYRFSGKLRFRNLVLGGTPTDDKVATAWLKTKFADNDEVIAAKVVEIMLERGITDKQEALKVVGDLKMLKGFKRDSTGLYLEGRVLKSCFKEGVAVASSADKIQRVKFGAYKQAGVRSFVAEHVQVDENKLYLLENGKPVQKEHGILQRFVHTFNGNGINYEEYLSEVELTFTIRTDWADWGEDFWPVVWLTAGEQGLGASRSMGYGRFDVIEWTAETLQPPKPARRAPTKVASGASARLARAS